MSVKVMGRVWDDHTWDQRGVLLDLRAAFEARRAAAIAERAEKIPKTPPTEIRASVLKFVLLAIADHAHHDGTNSYPSVEELASMTELDDRTVRRAIWRLEALGKIAVEVNGAPDPRIPIDKRPNHYIILDRGGRESPRDLTARPPAGQGAGTDPENDRGGRESPRDLTARPPATGRPAPPRGGSDDAAGGQAAPQTVLEPKNPPTPAQRGPDRRSPRADGTNPRAVGTNPRARDPKPVEPVPVYPSIEETRARLAADAAERARAAPMPVDLRRRIGKTLADDGDIDEATG